jgi:WhiB family redox-sensing transcriptional regulator
MTTPASSPTRPHRGPSHDPRVLALPDRAITEHAACVDYPDVFLLTIEAHPNGDRRKEAVTVAKYVCGRCTVRRRCLDWALGILGEQYGVLGGLDADERAQLIRKRQP